MTEVAATPPPMIQRLLDAVIEARFDLLPACFTPDCRLRAMTPDNVYGSFGADAVPGHFRNWFGDADQIALIASSIEPVGARWKITYRLDVTEEGVRTVVEQIGFLAMEKGQISDLTLVCSGKQPWETVDDA
jgi:hypothetical protein